MDALQLDSNTRSLKEATELSAMKPDPRSKRKQRLPIEKMLGVRA
jgi:hypothetical protein